MYIYIYIHTHINTLCINCWEKTGTSTTAGRYFLFDSEGSLWSGWNALRSALEARGP